MLSVFMLTNIRFDNNFLSIVFNFATNFLADNVTLKSAWKCHPNAFEDAITCEGATTIQINTSYFGISPCHDQSESNRCCLNDTDCLFEVDTYRLDTIRGYCDWRQICDEQLVAERTGYFTCHDTNVAWNDYEIIYYKCVLGEYNEYFN